MGGRKSELRAPPAHKPDELPESVLNFWYPVCYVTELVMNEVFPTELFGEPLVLFRNSSGKAVCIQDVCPHRSTPLSIGFVKEGELYCRYHGWRFGGEDGACTAVPSIDNGRVPKAVKTQGHPTMEAQGFIWVFPGDASLADASELPTEMPEYVDKSMGYKCIDQVWDSSYPYISVMENLLDPCHLQFTHEGKQQKNIAPIDKMVPEAFNFEAWDYRTDTMLKKWAFCAHIKTESTTKPLNYKLITEPPCLQRAEIRVTGSWVFAMNHYITPLRPGRTRIFLRFARNFLQFVPDLKFSQSNSEVMQQDITVLTGQQMRLRQGASRWNFPVAADTASQYYRKWWETSLENHPEVWFKAFTRTNVVKNAMEKGCVRAEESQIEDLAPHIAPNSGVKDHLDGLSELWTSPGTLKWPSKPREQERAKRTTGAWGLVKEKTDWKTTLLNTRLPPIKQILFWGAFLFNLIVSFMYLQHDGDKTHTA